MGGHTGRVAELVSAVAFLCAACAEEPPTFVCASSAPADVTLVVAGSGTNLPSANALAGAIGVPVRVPESIGSTGAIRAVQDGELEVGLTSRPLTSEEAASGLVRRPYALSIMVIASNGLSSGPSMTEDELVALYNGGTLPDGTRPVLLTREPGDSGLGVIERAAPRLYAAMTEAGRRGDARVLHSDPTMVDTLARTKGALGFVDLNVVQDLDYRHTLRVHGFNGSYPTTDAARQGRYPLVKTMALVHRNAPLSADAKRFVEFVHTAQGMAALERVGLIPAGGDK